MNQGEREGEKSKEGENENVIIGDDLTKRE